MNLSQSYGRISPSLAINERSNRLIAEGREILKLGLGQSPFPVPGPVVEVLQENAHQKDYLPVKGLQALREAVAAYHNRFNGLEADVEDIFIGPGSKELIFQLQLVLDADLVLPSPHWVSYEPQANLLGRQVHRIETSINADWRLTPDQLRELGESHHGKNNLLVLLNYPCNPTGQTYDAQELMELAEVARTYGMIILSDEIYGELYFDEKHTSIAQFYPEGTVVTAGLSKWCGAGGWRLGTALFPKEMREVLNVIAAVASETFTAVSAPVQYAGVRAFEGGENIETYLLHSRRILKALSAHCTEKLSDADARVLPAQGGFYLYPDLSEFTEAFNEQGISTSGELCERLLEETGVAILPGTAFGRKPEELSMRLAFVDFDGKSALEAASGEYIDQELSEAFLVEYCPRVVKAMDRMSEWIKEITAVKSEEPLLA